MRWILGIDSSHLGTQCSFMVNNQNFQKLLQKELDLLKNTGKKPKLLLHACCGPCFTIPYEIIKDYFDITIIYNNSNIYPENEHNRRLKELKKYLKDIKGSLLGESKVHYYFQGLKYIEQSTTYITAEETNNLSCRYIFIVVACILKELSE